jgi:hypothetical protein
MTEDLHNDIDDLFRSGLEGKEDAPSPDVWAAIAKNLPATPAPPPPAPAAPAATGGLSSAAIIKGLTGMIVIAMVGAAVYFFNSKDDANKSEILTDTSSTQIPGTTAETPSETVNRTFDTEPKTEEIDATRVINDQENKSDGRVTSDPENAVTTKKNSVETEKNITPAMAGNKFPAGRSRLQTITDPNQKTGPSIDQHSVSKTGSIAGTKTETARSIPDGKKEHVTRMDRKIQNTGVATQQISLVSDLSRNNQVEGRKVEARTGKPTDHSERPFVPVESPNAGIADWNRHTGVWSGVQKQHPTWPARLPRHAILTEKTPAPASSNTSADASKQGGSSLKQNKWTSRLYIIPTYSINMTHMEVEENESFGPRIGREHIEFKETERTRTTASPGIIAGVALSPRISIQTGLAAFRNDIEISPKQIRAIRDRDGSVRYRLDCSTGSYFFDPKAGSSPSVGDSLKIASSNITMRYASIPVAIRLNIGGDRVKLFATAGGEYNLLTGKKTSTSLSAASSDKVSQVRSEGTRKSYLNGSLGAGMEVRAGKRLSIIVTPQYRFPLSNINEEGPVRTSQKTFSITSGLRIGF